LPPAKSPKKSTFSALSGLICSAKEVSNSINPPFSSSIKPNKEMQGGGPLIDMGIHMLDAAMFVLGFPKVKKVTAKSFQKIG
ncbi:Gfo/Idh/MocA family protein, partial [Listeria monocytogenes]|uniref:Gfo/Idh/MocA family protein n=1 Tax=Listeria monocytogenes TaxID=1639 RepID=UPI003F74E53F